MLAIVLIGAISALGGGNGGLWENNTARLTEAYGAAPSGD